MVKPGNDNEKVEALVTRVASAMASTASNSGFTPLLSASSAMQPGLLLEDLSSKHHGRRTSDASSALTSLPDGDSATSHPAGGTVSPHIDLSSSLSSLSSTMPAGPSSGLSTSAENVGPPITPATSRMSTRSLTASQSKSRPEEDSPSNIIPHAHATETKPAPLPEKRTLRSSRASALPSENETSKGLHDSNQVHNAQPTRQMRHCLPSAATKESKAGSSDAMRSVSGVVAKTTPVKSKLEKPVGNANGGTQAAKKLQPNVPLCGTCSNELPGMIGDKSASNAVHTCARYLSSLFYVVSNLKGMH